MPERQPTVFLAGDKLLDGVRAVIDLVPELVVVGATADYEGLIAGARRPQPTWSSPTSACPRASSGR